MTKFIIPLLLIACGSESTTNYTYLGSTSTDTGGNSSQQQTGGNSNITNSTGGNSQTTSEATGGYTNHQPNSGGSQSTGGSVNNTGGSSQTTCIKKTCEETLPDWDNSSPLSKPSACGFPSDGCGGILNCGSCISDATPNTDCGQAPPSGQDDRDWSGKGLIPTQNICGTRCVRASSTEGICDNGIPMWICPSTIPPLGYSNCKIINTEAHTWCCD